MPVDASRKAGWWLAVAMLFAAGCANDSGPRAPERTPPPAQATAERPVDPRVCRTCGREYFGLECPHCRGLRPAFGRAVCAFRAEGAARRLIHRMKYSDAPWLAEDLADAALEDEA